MSSVLDVAKSLCFICRVKKCRSDFDGFLQQFRRENEGIDNAMDFPSLGRYRCDSTSSSSTDDDINLIKPNSSQERNTLTEDLCEMRSSLDTIIGLCHRHEMLQSSASDRIGELLRILRRITEKWPPFQSHPLLVATETLTELCKNSRTPQGRPDARQWLAALDKLSTEFNKRVSEYFMGDYRDSEPPLSRSQSCENFSLMNEQNEYVLTDKEEATMNHDEDLCLMKSKEGVDFALNHLKQWSKYAKDILSYIERKTQFEMEYAQQLEKLAHSAKIALKDYVQFPFHSVYCSAVCQDIEHSKGRLQTSGKVQGQSFIEPLTSQISDVDKDRKHLKDVWHRELKKTHEAVNNMLRAKAMYIQRCQDYVRARLTAQKVENGEMNGKAEKKRKMEDDALQKAMEAETTYKACIVEANERQKTLSQVKSSVLHQLRNLVYQCDRTMKTLTHDYFLLQYNMYSPFPNQLQDLCDTSQEYEIGAKYNDYINKLPVPNNASHYPNQYVFEPYSINDSLNESSHSSMDSSDSWNDIRNHPFLFRRSFSEVEENDSNRLRFSKAAETHSFRKLRTPSKCRRCDNYVYFQGVECCECGLSCHKKCLEMLVIQCGHRRLRPKMTTFGVDLTTQAESTGEPVPAIVRKCITEVENKGCLIKGIYRVSGVKSDVENLCQTFENGPELVDLSEVPTTVITSVLKHYFRQLPEPVLTFELYPDFIRIAKESTSKKETEDESILEDLQNLIQRLPPVHYITLAYLIKHLKRVAKFAEHNNMPASNLGIVFGPTLMRRENDSNSISCLMDTIHQTKVIDLLITYCTELFGDDSEASTERLNTPNKLQTKQAVNVHGHLTRKLSMTCTLTSADKRSSWSVTSTGEGVVLLPPTESQVTTKATAHVRNDELLKVSPLPRTPKNVVSYSDEEIYKKITEGPPPSQSKLCQRPTLPEKYNRLSHHATTKSDITQSPAPTKQDTPPGFSCNLSRVQIAGIRKQIPLSISLTTQLIDSGPTNGLANNDTYEYCANVCMV